MRRHRSVSRTELRRLAHRLCALVIESHLGSGWEIGSHLPEDSDREIGGRDHDFLQREIQAVADKLWAIGAREGAGVQR